MLENVLQTPYAALVFTSRARESLRKALVQGLPVVFHHRRRKLSRLRNKLIHLTCARTQPMLRFELHEQQDKSIKEPRRAIKSLAQGN